MNECLAGSLRACLKGNSCFNMGWAIILFMRGGGLQDKVTKTETVQSEPRAQKKHMEQIQNNSCSVTFLVHPSRWWLTVMVLAFNTKITWRLGRQAKYALIHQGKQAWQLIQWTICDIPRRCSIPRVPWRSRTPPPFPLAQHASSQTPFGHLQESTRTVEAFFPEWVPRSLDCLVCWTGEGKSLF